MKLKIKSKTNSIEQNFLMMMGITVNAFKLRLIVDEMLSQKFSRYAWKALLGEATKLNRSHGHI